MMVFGIPTVLLRINQFYVYLRALGFSYEEANEAHKWAVKQTSTTPTRLENWLEHIEEVAALTGTLPPDAYNVNDD